MLHTFADNPLDRAGHRRLDPVWLAARLKDPTSRLLPFHNFNPFLLNGELGWLRPGLIEAAWDHGGAVVFLGMAGDVAHFAMEMTGAPEALEGFGGDFKELRQSVLTGEVVGGDAAILAQGKAMLHWHARHIFCSCCGAHTVVADGGYKRTCPKCNAEHFPRTDPVVIMLAHRDGKALLGRGVNFPGKMMSALAGFVEPGETIEEAVAREIKEEAGIDIAGVTYHSSQPWPFPMSLMIGCLAEATSEAITIDPSELSDCRWIDRATLRDVLEGGGDGSFFVPPAMAIAHHLIRAFVYG